MAPTRAFSTPISTGERVSAAAFNQLDDGQFNSLSRAEVVSLLAAAGIDLGNLDFSISTSGSGKFKPDGGDTQFQTDFPGIATMTVSDIVPQVSPIFGASEYDPTARRIQQIAASKNLGFLLSLPIGTTLKSVTCYLKKASGTAGLPGSLPALELGYYTLSSDAFTQVGIVADAPADLTAYRAYHALTLGSLSHTVAAGRNYILTLYGDDDSANSGTGLYVYRPKITVEVTQIRAL